MTKEIVIGNNISEITHVTNFIAEIGLSLQLPSVTIMNLSLAIEEAIANIIKNRNPEKGEHEIKLKIDISQQEMVFTLMYNEIYSNFTLFDKISNTLIIQMMDEVSYKCANGERLLIMKKIITDKVKTEKTMTANICRVDGITVITIDGRLDTINAPDFDKIINSLLPQDYLNVIINCENLTYICSTGIRHLLTLQKNVNKHKGQLVLEAMKPEIYDIFLIVGGDNMFTIR